MPDTSIIRHRGKINSTFQSTQAFLALQKEFGSFNTYIWSFTKDQTIHRKEADIKVNKPFLL